MNYIITTIVLLIWMAFCSSTLHCEPDGSIAFHETWNRYFVSGSSVIEIRREPTCGLWSDDIAGNCAYVVPATDTCARVLHGCYLSPNLTSDGRISDLPYVAFMPNGHKPECSVMLPFGAYGLNRIRYSFPTPYYDRGCVDSFIWVKSKYNMRQRGVTVVLETPSGHDARVSFGMWAGTTSPSYKIEGIRVGQAGYDDKIYHRLPEITLMGEGTTPTCAGTWNDFAIDIGLSDPNHIIFKYRNHLVGDSQYHKMDKPLEVILGRDYTGIKEIIIGAMPFAVYSETNAKHDDRIFVGDVMLRVPIVSEDPVPGTARRMSN